MSGQLQYPFGAQDCYGCCRDELGAIVFPIDNDERELSCTDAQALGELHSLKLPVAGLPVLDRSQLDDGRLRPIHYIITSPNMDWLPDLSRDLHEVHVRTDGRYYVHDFSLVPQWYFRGTYYLPFVLLRPNDDDIIDHPYHLAWFDIELHNFVADTSNPTIGLLSKQLVTDFIEMRDTLASRATEVLSCRSEDNGEVYRDLHHSLRGMRMVSCLLTFAPQTWLMTVLTVTKFQRYFLETLAIIDYLTIWLPRRNIGAVHHLVDRKIVGAVTGDLLIAQDLFSMGVPVWLVRPPALVSSKTRVRSQIFPSLPRNICRDIFPGSSRVIAAPPSASRNRVCQVLTNVTINLGHSFLEQQACDPNQPVHQGALKHTPESPRGSSSFHFAPSATASGPNKVQGSLPTFAPSVPSYKLKKTFSNQSPRLVCEQKFEEPESEHCLLVLQGWSEALAAVNREDSRLIGTCYADLFRGYPLPDPYIFARKGSEKYIIGWLAIRASWHRELLNGGVAINGFPRPQNWKDILYKVFRDHASSPVSPTGVTSTSSEVVVGVKRSSDSNPSLVIRPDYKKVKTSGVRGSGRLNDRMLEFLMEFPPSLDQGVSWNGVIVLNLSSIRDGRLDLGKKVIQGVLWEAYENNFRLELLALARTVGRVERWSTERLDHMDALVDKVYPYGSILVGSHFGERDLGLGARQWQDRAQFVEAFKEVLLHWPGINKQRVRALTAGTWKGRSFCGNEQGVLALEKLLYPFYCQTFFNFFARAPTIPHHTPLL